MRLAGRVVATAVVTAVLQATGRLDGPTLVGGTALGEAVLAVAVTIPLAWSAVTWRRW